MNSNICFTFGVLERTNDQNKHHMNAIEFKNNLKVGKFQKTNEGFFDYTIEINGQNYLIGQPKRGKWAAYDEVEREYYAINNTRKDVLSDIISGLFYQYKHNL